MVPIHRHPTKDESFVILRGKVGVTTHNDDGAVIGDVVLSRESVDIGDGSFWHCFLFCMRHNQSTMNFP